MQHVSYQVSLDLFNALTLWKKKLEFEQKSGFKIQKSENPSFSKISEEFEISRSKFARF